MRRSPVIADAAVRNWPRLRKSMRISVIGAGISGIAAIAKTLMGFGHEVIVCEKEAVIGGVWATAYPGVTLQNIAEHYRLTDFPWPFKPQSHPTAEEVRRYLDAAVRHFKLDVRLAHDVSSLAEAPEGWVATIRGPAGTTEERFDYVLVATGQYSGDKTQVDLPGHDSFTGTVLRDRQITDLEIFRNARSDGRHCRLRQDSRRPRDLRGGARRHGHPRLPQCALAAALHHGRPRHRRDRDGAHQHILPAVLGASDGARGGVPRSGGPKKRPHRPPIGAIPRRCCNTPPASSGRAAARPPRNG